MDAITQKAVDRLNDALNPIRIYLFGSRARGTYTIDSDYDFLVIVKDSDLPQYKRNIMGYKALKGLGISKDVIVITEREFERARKVVCSLAATVEREGVLLHAA